jgi:hypothetical protein
MHHISRTSFAALISCLFAVCSAGRPLAAGAGVNSTQPADAGPDLALLHAAAVRTTERLKTSAAAWTALLDVDDRKVIVDVIQAPGRKRTIITMIGNDNQPIEIARVIEKDDTWYVREKGRPATKYRALECPFMIASVPMFMNRAAVNVVTGEDQQSLGTFERLADGLATYRRPLSAQIHDQIQGLIRQEEETVRQNPSLLERKGTRERLALFDDVLARGSPVRVNVADGTFQERGIIPSFYVRSSSIRWLNHADDAEFAIDATAWEDCTADPTLGNPQERDHWVMLWHTLLFDPKTLEGDSDARLVDLRTGGMRRIPYDGEISSPGCFLKGRDKVVVTGTSDGGWGLYEIDLKTRANRRLAAAVLAGKSPMVPVLSPDGRTLAVTAADYSNGFGHAQVVLVDVETGKGRQIGPSFDAAFVSWTPDGMELILQSGRPSVAPHLQVSTICRMDLEGRLRPIRRGYEPLVLADGRILFQELTADCKHWTWKTCDLQGKDEHTFGDGLDGFIFPAQSPDGKRILMVRDERGRGPTPYVFPLGQQPGEPALQMPGNWGCPAWR